MLTGRRLGSWALAACLLLAGCSMTARRATSGQSRVPAPVVVVGVGGLTWDTVSPEATPRLWRLLADGAAAGATAVRQIGPSCPVDGWLSLSSGRATAGPRSTSDRPDGTDRRNGACGPVPEVRPLDRETDRPTDRDRGEPGQPTHRAFVPHWQDLQDLQETWEFSPHLGLLADALADHGVCATAVGPGAALALADSEGVVGRYQDTLGRDPFDCPVTVVDAGSVVHPARDLSEVDRRVGEVLDQAPEEATVLVTGVSESPGSPPELAAALLSGPPVDGAPRFLVTRSTRWDGVIRLLDVPSTVMAAVGGSDPGDFSGAPIRLGGQRPSAPEETVRVLDDVTRADQIRGTWADDFRTWLGAAQLALYGLALLAIDASRRRKARRRDTAPNPNAPYRHGDADDADPPPGDVAAGSLGTDGNLSRPGTRGGGRRWDDVPGQRWLTGRIRGWVGSAFTAVVLWMASLPVAAYLVTLSGWWRAGTPAWTLWGGMAAIAAGIAVVAGRLPRRRLWWTTGGLSLLTFVVLVVDALSGTVLHRGSLLGPSPALGGRFFGFGNDTFCVFVVVALLLAGAVGQELLTQGRRRLAVGSVVALGAVTVLIDVWPTWGADVGGGLALLPGIALLALVVADVDVTVPRLAGAAVGGVALVAGVAVVDWLRPERERTHLGRFVQGIFDGDAWEVIARKAGYARDSLDGGLPMWITLTVLVAAAAALLRPERHAPGPLKAAFEQWPTLRATLEAILLTVVLGSLVNDYGLRIATISLTMGLPFVALICALAASSEHPMSVADQNDLAGRDQEQVRA